MGREPLFWAGLCFSRTNLQTTFYRQAGQIVPITSKANRRAARPEIIKPDSFVTRQIENLWRDKLGLGPRQ